MMHLSKDDLRLVIKVLRRRWRRYGSAKTDATVLYRFMRDLEHSYLPAHLFRAFGSSLEQEEWSPSIAAFLLRISPTSGGYVTLSSHLHSFPTPSWSRSGFRLNQPTNQGF